MLATLNIGVWTARKVDKRVTAEVNAQHGADADAGRYNKLLIHKTALQELTDISGEARRLHYEVTLAWADGNGPRILSAPLYDRWISGMRALKVKHGPALARFVANYPAYYDDARRRLNGMFNESDYPAPGDIERKFYFEFRARPLPVSNDFRASIAEGEAARIRAEIEAEHAHAARDMLKEVYGRIRDVLVREDGRGLVDKLSAFRPSAGKGDKAEGIFRDSLIGNVAELVALLPAFNVVGDPELTAITDRLAALCPRDMSEAAIAEAAEALRRDPARRADALAEARSIASAVSDYLA
jgi:hypothetical protein